MRLAIIFNIPFGIFFFFVCIWYVYIYLKKTYLVHISSWLNIYFSLVHIWYVILSHPGARLDFGRGVSFFISSWYVFGTFIFLFCMHLVHLYIILVRLYLFKKTYLVSYFIYLLDTYSIRLNILYERTSLKPPKIENTSNYLTWYQYKIVKATTNWNG